MLELSYLPAGPVTSPSHTLAGLSPALLQTTIERCVQQIRQILAQTAELDTPTKETALSNLGIISSALQCLSEHDSLRSSISARTGLRYLAGRTEEVISILRTKTEVLPALNKLVGVLSSELRLRDA